MGQGQHFPDHNTILFAGQNLDTATGLYYDHARWYNPGSGVSQGGTFLTRDPMGYAAGDANLYRYCGNNPVSPTDPTGLVAVAPQNAGNVTGPWNGGTTTGYYITWHSFTIFVPNGTVVRSAEGYNGATISVSLGRLAPRAFGRWCISSAQRGRQDRCTGFLGEF